MKKLGKIIIAILSIVTICSVSVLAAPSFDSYGYNAWGESVPQPDGYMAQAAIDGKLMGSGALKEPQDMFCSDDGLNFIADTGNNRILILNKEWKLQKEIKTVMNKGKAEVFNAPEGVFYDGKYIYVADTGNKRILKLDISGKVITEFTKPTSASFDQKVDFKPSKVTVDGTGTVYTLVEGLYRGAILFTPNGEFDGFFGSNSVSVTAEVMLNRVLAKFMTKTQREKQIRNIPVEFTNFDIDDEGFIYTCTSPKVTTSDSGQLKKLNSGAKNIFVSDKDIAWASGKFGDMETQWIKGQVIATDFVDVAVDENGFVVALDYTKGRIFEYNSSCELTFVFGGKSNGQLGTFSSPVAIDTADGKVYVLDAGKNNITVFEKTETGKTVHNAILLHNEGKYSEATELWKRVVDSNANFEIAYLGLGKAYYQMKDYERSMQYYELANDNIGRSQAFEDYRSIWLNNNLPWIFGILIALCVAVIVLRYLPIKRRALGGNATWFKDARGLMLHPLQKSEEMKQKRSYSYIVSIVVLALFFIANLAVYQFTGRNFNINKPDTLNVFLISLRTILPFILFVVANWSVTTLLEGKGNFGQIFCFSAYSLIPYTIGLWISVPLSYCLSYNEAALLSGVTLITIIWSALLLVGTLMSIHQYSLKKTIISILFTVFGMLVMAFLILMLYSLVQQIYVFLYTVFAEIKFRI